MTAYAPTKRRRTTLVALLAWVLAALLLALDAAAASTPATRPAAASVDHVSVVVSNADRAAEFYTRVLDFKPVSDAEFAGRDLELREGVFGARCRVVRLSLHRESIDLIEFLTPRGRPVPPDSASNDRWFQHVAIITSDMSKAYARLRAARVRHASTGPQRLPDWNPGAGGIEAFYFHDPDGHVLEVLHFPAGKGEPRWHAATDLFLGIDHTAIVTADTARSLAFYRERLGMRVAGTGENWGDEQEHLNNVFGARLRITTLRAETGPGVELLEYLAPTTGRPYPADGKANDLFGWRTVIGIADAGAAAQTIRSDHRPRVSSAITPDPTLAGNPPAFVTRDPDGHLVELFQIRPPQESAQLGDKQ